MQAPSEQPKHQSDELSNPDSATGGLLMLTSGQITEELRAVYPHVDIYALDATYNVVSRAAVDAYNEELSQMLFAAGALRWSEQFDCEDFAACAWALAKQKHLAAARHQGDLAQGVAVGMLCYRLDGAPHRGHAINIIRTVGGWMTYEPQTRRWTTLNPAENASAWLALL
ncbi:MAG: hypothetical protein E1N59_2847 [Puniceicoccaceae bacterium 5H]|nr:MAG: hypothetical protein E1N59_2847 [Puniceicoccaceae bacterium 5H]